MALSSSQLKSICKRPGFGDWVLWFGLGGWALSLFIQNGNPLGGALAVAFLLTGVLQLCAHRLTWPVGLAAWLILVIFSVVISASRGFAFTSLVWIAASLWGAWTHYRDRPRFLALSAAAEGGDAEPDESIRYSLVLFLREPLYLDVALLGQIASRVYGVPFNNDDDNSECFIVGAENAPYMMRVHDGMFIVHNWARPYFDDPAAVADGLRELRRANAVREHRAWFSVDFIRASAPLPDEKIHDAIGRLLAEIASTGAAILAVYHPATRRIEPWDAAFIETLGGGDPLSIFENDQVPVIQVASDSPAMAAAVAEARRRWPEFLAAYQAATDKEPFSVKAPVTEAGRTEFIWINVKAIAGDEIHGLLANDPVALGDLKLGSFVTVRVSELNDWVCPDPSAPDRPLGLFTVKAVADAARG